MPDNSVMANSGYVNPARNTITGTGYGVELGTAGVITNQGAIYATDGSGVEIHAAGSFVNAPGALTNGSVYGVFIGGAGHVFNSGSLTGGSDGALITGVGHVYNYANAYLAGGLFGVDITGAGNVINDGTFASSLGVGIEITGAALVTNEAQSAINGDSYGIDALSGATIENFGFITASSTASGGMGVRVGAAGEVINETGGTISGALYGVDMVGVATVENAGLISGGNFAVLIGPAAGQLVVDAGGVFVGKVEDAGGGGGIELTAGTPGSVGSLDLGSSFSGFSSIKFDTGATWTLKGAASDLAGSTVIDGFTFGDTIDLEGFTASSDTYVSGTGLELSNGAASVTLDITGAFQTSNFQISELSDGSTQIIICYLRGTSVLTPLGEVKVEDLRIGDLLVTRWQGVLPVKWIGRQSFDARFVRHNRDRVPVRFKPGALGRNQPRRDLYVSPGHSMLIEDTLVLARSLVNGVTVTQDEVPDEIHYYMIEFESHDCLLADGAWSESFADCIGLRDKFHNVGEFEALYPDYVTPRTLSLCAARPERGAALASLLRPLVARAASGLAPGALRGSIDALDEGGKIHGWAQDQAHPLLPVMLEVLLGDEMIGTVLACDYRDDLDKAGIGAGRCSFVFEPRLPIPDDARLHIRRASDGAEIYMSEACRARLPGGAMEAALRRTG